VCVCAVVLQWMLYLYLAHHIVIQIGCMYAGTFWAQQHMQKDLHSVKKLRVILLRNIYIYIFSQTFNDTSIHSQTHKVTISSFFLWPLGLLSCREATNDSFVFWAAGKGEPQQNTLTDLHRHIHTLEASKPVLSSVLLNGVIHDSRGEKRVAV